MGNIHVYVVDENLVPVPLGAPGLIVVLRGVRRPRLHQRPRAHRRGVRARPAPARERLCRTGDYGRWRPDGKLEFLGRRDTQVKICGFRIEIGEIDNALLRVPGVRDGAVVVAEGPDRGKYLVAFYCGPQPLEVDILRERLATTLPQYMVPSTFHWREKLPLTANGKIDRTALTALAAELDAASPDGHDARRPPRPSGGLRPHGRRCSASPRTRSAATTTSSTAAAPRSRR